MGLCVQEGSWAVCVLTELLWRSWSSLALSHGASAGQNVLCCHCQHIQGPTAPLQKSEGQTTPGHSPGDAFRRSTVCRRGQEELWAAAQPDNIRMSARIPRPALTPWFPCEVWTAQEGVEALSERLVVLRSSWTRCWHSTKVNNPCFLWVLPLLTFYLYFLSPFWQ